MESLRVCMCEMAHDATHHATRAGRKTDADFKAWKKYPHGIVTNIGGSGIPLSFLPFSRLQGSLERRHVCACLDRERREQSND